jgi:hypothetical protein
MDIKERVIQCKRHFGNKPFPGSEELLHGRIAAQG